MNRATLARVCAKLQIEIEDRTEGDTELGRRLIEHHGILGKLHLIPGPR